MRALSAADAISPAIQRTRNLLFRPFRFGTFLKLCAVAVLTEGFSGNFNQRHSGGQAHINPGFAPYSLTPDRIAIVIFVALGCFVLGFAIYYLVVRLRFALFNCLTRQTTEIRPGWHFYREPALRFFVFSLIVGVVYLVVALAAVVPFILKFFHLSQQTEGHPDLGQILGLVLPLIPVILLLIFVGILIDIVMRDFMLPHMALENASVGEAWDSVLSRIVAEKGAFLFYGLLRIVLPLGALIALFIALAIPMVVIFGSLGLMMAGIQAAGQGSGGVAAAAVVLQLVLGLLIFLLALFLAIFFGGPLSIAIRNYALVFYGGRYRVLGDLLNPPLPPAPLPAGSPGA